MKGMMKMTNFERIKKMNVEEFAAYILSLTDLCCEECPARDLCGNSTINGMGCNGAVKQWLESEAEEDE